MILPFLLYKTLWRKLYKTLHQLTIFEGKTIMEQSTNHSSISIGNCQVLIDGIPDFFKYESNQNQNSLLISASKDIKIKISVMEVVYKSEEIEGNGKKKKSSSCVDCNINPKDDANSQTKSLLQKQYSMGRHKEQKTMLLLQTLEPESKSSFYLFDIEVEQGSPEFKLDTLHNVGEVWGCTAVLGSDIYVISNDDDEEEASHILGVRASCLEVGKFISQVQNLHDTWKPIPDRNLQFRERAKCASFGGKIYVLGGSMVPHPFSFGQVFDPELGAWNDVCSPPSDRVPIDHSCVASPVIPDERNSRLIVYFRSVESIYAYYPDSCVWECLVEHFDCRDWSASSVALLDDILYIQVQKIDRFDCIGAYDLASQKWLKVAYSSPFPYDYDLSCAFFHLGNEVMCLATYYHGCKQPFDINCSSDIIVKMVKFRVRVNCTSEEVLVTPLALNTYTIENQDRCRPICLTSICV